MICVDLEDLETVLTVYEHAPDRLFALSHRRDCRLCNARRNLLAALGTVTRG